MRWPENLELVLMPGLDGTGIMFKQLIDEIHGDIPVTVVTYPNNEKPLSYPQLVEHAAGKIPADRPVIILAESFSGPIAVNLLGRGIPNARGAVFCATFVTPPQPFLLNLAGLMPLEILFHFPAPDVLLRAVCLGEDAPSSLVSLLREAINAAKPANIAARFRMLVDINEASALERINIPCRYVQALRDNLVPSGNVEPFVNMVADLQVKKVSGPHFLLQTRPAEVLRILYDFADDLTRNEK